MEIHRCFSIYIWDQAFPTSGSAVARFCCPYADPPLGTLGVAHRAAGAAALIAGGAFAGANTKSTRGSRALRVHFELS